jgi:hypothetical protein
VLEVSGKAFLTSVFFCARTERLKSAEKKRDPKMRAKLCGMVTIFG